MGQSVAIMELLRTETRLEHRRIEVLPFAVAIATSRLALESYVAFLNAFRIIHTSMDEAFTRIDHPVLRSIWDETMQLTPRLERDLAFFAPRNIRKSLVVSIRAQIVAQRIRQRSSDEPLSLLGYLYVLMGATLGGTILRSQIAQTFGLEDTNGLAYLSSHDEAPTAPWNRFRQRMNASSFDQAAQQGIIDAANEAFSLIAQIIDVLHPFEGSDAHKLARTLNAEAGRHFVPVDEREVDAALRAGEWTWRRFPYYKLRYGSRGERFTRSDSAWLVTLAGHEQSTIDHQITWLGQVLSARGMPQWLLEHHLRHLYKTLTSVIPEKTATYERLLRAADVLKTRRENHMSDEVMIACGTAFEGRVGSEWIQKMPEAGYLLAAAVADERQGVMQAVPSIENWMTDSHRFPPHWIDAVNVTIRIAREQAR